MNKLTVDTTLCNACGMCFTSCDLLEENDEGKAQVVLPGIVDGEILGAVQSVVELCPVAALRIEEDATVLNLDDVKAKIRQTINFVMPDKSLYAYDENSQ